MSRWWRAHDEAVDDPKLQQLPDALFKAWFNICCITSQNGGKLPAINDIAFKLHTTPAKTRKILADLKAAVLIDDDGEGNSAPHNWDARQFKSDVTDPTNAERQQRYRDRHRVTDNTVTDTVTVTPTRDRAETEQKAKTADAVSIEYVFAGGIIKLSRKHFDNWTEAYPKIDLRAELTARDAWLGSDRATDNDRKSWFISTSKYLANRNQEAKTQIAVRREPEREPGAIREII